MKALFKVFLITSAMVAFIIIAFHCVIGSEITLEVCSLAITIATIASVVVIAIWYLIGMWVCGPFAKYLTKTIEMIGRL
jgi:hypothetical protein